MEWRVIKTGSRQFDMLHAYGLGILLATAYGTAVELGEAASSYSLSCSIGELAQRDNDALLERLFVLPDEESVLHYNPHAQIHNLPITILDGLLAALFTIPGPRILSVSDLLRKYALDPTILQKALLKVAKKANKWKAFVLRVASWKRQNWLDDMLSDYDPMHPACPLFVEATSDNKINIVMTIDPSLSYSLRSPYSDGRTMERTQITVQGARYAGLLVYLGASRFLRSHRLSGGLVNYYLPLARRCSMYADTTQPLLLSADQRPDQAALWQWLALAQQSCQETIWSGLAYQTLLTQGIQQSLSLEHGELECGWLFRLQKDLGNGVLRFWQFQVSAKGGMQDAQEDLCDCLKWRNVRAWRAHLVSKARTLIAHPDSVERRYSLEEVRIITEAMKNSAQEPWKIVMEREEGTRCFGRALRQIGRFDSSKLRDLTDELEAVRTRAQLLPVLQHIVLASELAKAKEQRIVVPTEKDMTILSEDVERFGIPEVIGLLLVLSALRYSRRNEQGELKVEVSTVIRALSTLTRYLEAISSVSEDAAPEIFLDDPELTGESNEAQEEA
jgi:hypothetical protein